MVKFFSMWHSIKICKNTNKSWWFEEARLACEQRCVFSCRAEFSTASDLVPQMLDATQSRPLHSAAHLVTPVSNEKENYLPFFPSQRHSSGQLIFCILMSPHCWVCSAFRWSFKAMWFIVTAALWISVTDLMCCIFSSCLCGCLLRSSISHDFRGSGRQTLLHVQYLWMKFLCQICLMCVCFILVFVGKWVTIHSLL